MKPCFSSLLLSVSLCLSLLLLLPTKGQDPYREGAFREQGLIREIRPDGAIGEILSVVYPLEPGNYPVVFFVGGLQGFTSYLGYKSIVSHIVSHGVVLVGMSTFPLGPDDIRNAEGMKHALSWLSTNLNPLLETEVPGLSADLQRTVLLGHSAGCKVNTRFLKNGCDFSGVINPLGVVHLDPVDGSDPWGLIKEFVIEEGEILQFSLPSLFLGTGLGPIPSNNRTIGPLPWPSCAPKGVNSPRFYNAYVCNKWWHMNNNFGHVDFMDQPVVLANNLVNVCSSNDASLIAFNNYRTYVAGAASALILAVVRGDPSFYRFIEDRSLIPRADMIGVEIQFDTSCSGGSPKPGCVDL